MTYTAELPVHAAAAAFDSLADNYDDVFTRTPIGRAQRGVVWRALQSTFHTGDRILELNCGTGADAFFLSRMGISVLACDGSPRMIETARRRQTADSGASPIEFRVLQTEEIGRLAPEVPFDGVLSNFSGLNCVENLNSVASDLAGLTKPGARVCICLSTRVCLWEMFWFTLHGNFEKALRRVRGRTVAQVGGQPIRIWYPTIRSIKRSFTPSFRLRSIRAVGLAVPPTYVGARKILSPRMMSLLEKVDHSLGRFPVLRGIGDHVFLTFEKVMP